MVVNPRTENSDEQNGIRVVGQKKKRSGRLGIVATLQQIILTALPSVL